MPPSAAPAQAAAQSSDRPAGRRPPVQLGPFSPRKVHLLGSLVAAGLLLIALTRPISTATPAADADPASLIHRWAATESGLGIGQRAPGLVGGDSGDVQLTDLDGRAVTLAAYAGRPLWIVFWATWCPACQREMPDLIATYRRHASDGLVVLAINAQESADVVRQHVAANRIPYPVVLDPTSAARNAYAVLGLPTHYFIDGGSVIRDRAFGRLTSEQMEERVQRLVGQARGGPESDRDGRAAWRPSPGGAD